MFFHSRSRSWEFLGMIASDSHSRIVGMDFFHSLPVPELWEWIFFIPFPFPNFGNRFFHSLPIPEFWEWFFFIPFPFPNWGNGFFQFPSRSRTSGMELSIPVPVPELPNVIPAHPCLNPSLTIIFHVYTIHFKRGPSYSEKILLQGASRIFAKLSRRMFGESSKHKTRCVNE